MATLFLKTGEPGKQEKRYMDKAAVRKLLERKDEKIIELKESNSHRFVKIHSLYSEIENLKYERKFLWGTIAILGGIISGYAILCGVL